MAATKAAIGFGASLTHATTFAGTYTAIGEITDIKPGKVTAEKIQVNRFDSPDLFGEIIPGWKNGGEFDITLTYDKSQYATLLALVAIPLFWKFVKPLLGTETIASSSSFAGFVIECGDETPLKDKMQITLKIAVSGAQTFTAGT